MAFAAASNEKDHQYEIKKILKLESEHEFFLSHIATINPRNNTVPPMKNRQLPRTCTLHPWCVHYLSEKLHLIVVIVCHNLML